MSRFKPQINLSFKPVLFTALALLNVAFVFAQIPTDPKLLKEKIAESAPDSNRAVLLLDLGTYCLNKPGESKSDMDSAMLLGQQALNISSKLKYRKGIGRSLLLKGQVYREKGDRKRSQAQLQNAIAYCSTYGLNEQIGEAYMAMSFLFGIEGADLDKRIVYSEKAAEYFKKGSLMIPRARTLESLGDLYQIKNDFDRSITLLKQALAIYEAAGYKDTQGVYNLLGHVYHFKGYDYNALKYLTLALKIAGQQKDSSTMVATIYNRLGSVYQFLSQPDKAVATWNKGLEVAKRNNDVYAFNDIQYRIINLLRREKKYHQALALLNGLASTGPGMVDRTLTAVEFANVYLGLKRYDLAKVYVDSLQNRVKDKSNAPWTFSGAYLIAAKYYFVTGQYKTANLGSVENEALNSMKYSVSNRAEYQLYWAKIDSALGNNTSALEHYKAYAVLNDSIVRGRTSKQLAELQLQYNLESKDQNIRILTQQSQLQQTRIHNQEIIRNMIVGGMLILLAFLGLLYNRFLLKQRANEKLAIKQDEINEQNKILQKLLGEKEWLLKEIHHRVKNNLQIVISLLNSQSAFLENKDALAAIQNSQNRMHAMSLIHQKLYQSGDVASIDMNWYIHELVNYTRESFYLSRRISFVLDIDPLDLDVAQAVPLGLILNEAITNSVKYAFPENEKGKITITLKACQDGSYLLSIGDNGVGLPPEFDLFAVESLGMSLMQGLSEQLDGSFAIHNDNGLHLSITFQKTMQLSIG